MDLDALVDLDTADFGLDGESLVIVSAPYQNTDAGHRPPPPPSRTLPPPVDLRRVDDEILVILL